MALLPLALVPEERPCGAVVEGTHGAYVASLVGASLASGNRIAVNGDGFEVQLFLAAKVATEGNDAVSEDIQNPLLPDSS